MRSAEVPEDLTQAINENAVGPKQVTVDGTTTVAHSLSDQIEAHKYQQALAARKRNRGIRIQRIRPGGAQ